MFFSQQLLIRRITIKDDRILQFSASSAARC
jgi:hypothetical protein